MMYKIDLRVRGGGVVNLILDFHVSSLSSDLIMNRNNVSRWFQRERFSVYSYRTIFGPPINFINGANT